MSSSPLDAASLYFTERRRQRAAAEATAWVSCCCCCCPLRLPHAFSCRIDSCVRGAASPLFIAKRKHPRCSRLLLPRSSPLALSRRRQKMTPPPRSRPLYAPPCMTTRKIYRRRSSSDLDPSSRPDTTWLASAMLWACRSCPPSACTGAVVAAVPATSASGVTRLHRHLDRRRFIPILPPPLSPPPTPSTRLVAPPPACTTTRGHPRPTLPPCS